MKLKERPRNEKGHFVKSSKLSDKNLGVRLKKDDYLKIVELSEERGLRPTELVREAVSEWLEMNSESENFRQPIAV